MTSPPIARCAWPQVVTLASGLSVLSGGRLCSENMYGGFLWTSDDPTSSKPWERFSLTYYHDQNWHGDPAYLFNDTTATPTASNVGTSCIMKHCGISSYEGLTGMNETAIVVVYTMAIWPAPGATPEMIAFGMVADFGPARQPRSAALALKTSDEARLQVKEGVADAVSTAGQSAARRVN
jgi:hypothetical protein